MSTADEFTAWFADLLAQHDDRRAALVEAHESLQRSGLLSKITLHRYMCARGCQIATVFRLSGLTLCAVRDYKLSPGLNEHATVPAARRKRTLDGDRHWPAHVYDVDELDAFRAGDQRAGMMLTCRHYRGSIMPADVLAAVAGVKPGHPGRPTRLR